MKVLMITGDRRFGPGNTRYDLQRAAVEELEVMYWGKGSLWSAIPQKKFDVVTVQDPFWRGLFAWRVARRLGARLNVQVHADMAGQSFARRLIAGIVLRRARSIRVVSKKLHEQVAQVRPSAPVHILPVFIDVSKFRSAVHRPHQTKTMLWIGRFEKEKNPLGAVDIFRTVHAQEPNSKLIMLGSGAMDVEIRSAARGLPIEFPGWQDPVSYLETADVVLCTSWHESFGASIIESLAAGVPVVAPDVGVAEEAGAIVVPYKKLAEAVHTVLSKRTQGQLLLTMPGTDEWKKKWQETL